jgi:hypothetical protein
MAPKSVRIAFAVVATAASLVAQNVSTSTVDVGGLGAAGCQNSDNPPTLSDGSPANASVGFGYDRATGRLTLTVENTTPATPGVQNPLLTQIFFNLPRLAVTGATLVSQTGSGGATPNFSLALDLDTTTGASPNWVGCFGAFSACLKKNGGGINGGIANAAADSPAGPPNGHVDGPVAFVIQLAGPGVANLTAGAFSGLRSVKSNGSAANVAIKFQGGAQGGSGFIGDVVDCSAAGWVVGEPKIGNTLTTVMQGSPGCYGCFVISLNPGPAIFDGILMPVGFPWLALNSQGFLFPGQIYTQQFAIPNDPALVGLIVYGAVGLTDAATQSTFSVTDQIVITIQDC